MLDISPDLRGVILKSGKEVNSDNIDYLDEKEITELVNSPASQYSIIRLNQRIHVLTNGINAVLLNIQSDYKDIKDSLIVQKVNGTIKNITLAEGVSELLVQHSGLRKRQRLLKAIRENKFLISILLIILIVGITLFTRNEWIMSAVVPIIILILKNLKEV